VVVVVATVPGSPGELAGVRNGDLLRGIDSIPVDDNRLDQAIRQLDGPVGSKVSLRLRRAGKRGLQTVEVVRGRLLRPAAVDTASLPGGVGRLLVRAFTKGVEDSVRLGVMALRAAGAVSLVLDLRGAVGGDLAQGASIADLFLNAGATIALSKSRGLADSVSYRDSTASPFDSLPVAVLVDEGTAGGAEVVAGALQDHDRAAVLGAITFGRGVTQSTFPLGGGASLRLTTALWLTPRGRQIQRPPRAADGDSVPRPKLKSDGGRSLLGGGGIVPDRVVLASGGTGDSVLALARSILIRGGSTRAVLALVTSH
jgi:carboxyl-terminal processing protease